MQPTVRIYIHLIIDVLSTYMYTNYRIQVALKELEPGNNIKIKPVGYGSRQSADFAAAMLRYCVDPPPSSSPG